MKTQTPLTRTNSQAAPQDSISIYLMAQILLIEKAEDYYFHTFSRNTPNSTFDQTAPQLKLNLK